MRDNSKLVEVQLSGVQATPMEEWKGVGTSNEMMVGR